MSAYEDGHADGYKEGLHDAGVPNGFGPLLLAYIIGLACGALATWLL